MIRFISDPDNIWTTMPQQTMNFVGFMHKVGTMKRLPASWKRPLHAGMPRTRRQLILAGKPF